MTAFDANEKAIHTAGLAAFGDLAPATKYRALGVTGGTPGDMAAIWSDVDVQTFNVKGDVSQLEFKTVDIDKDHFFAITSVTEPELFGTLEDRLGQSWVILNICITNTMFYIDVSQEEVDEAMAMAFRKSRSSAQGQRFRQGRGE